MKACTASNCNVVIKRHSRSVSTEKQCCGRCKSKLIEIEVPGSNADTAKAGYTPKRERKETSGFALFVKNQSSDVRKRLAKDSPNGVSQADVMKECGKLWRQQKAGCNGKENPSMGDALQDMANKLVSMSLNGVSP